MQSSLGNSAGSAIQKISDTIDTVVDNIRPPLATIPAMLLFCEMLQRPGMSATILASAIIEVLERLGIPTGPNPDGSQNLVVAATVGGCEKLVEHFQNFARVDVSGSPGSAAIEGVGMAAGVPSVQVSGTISSFLTAYGSIR